MASVRPPDRGPVMPPRPAPKPVAPRVAVAPPVAPTPAPTPTQAQPFPGYLTPQQQIDLARQQAEAFYKPYQDAIAAQQKTASEQTGANSTALGQLAQALAGMLGKIAPDVQGAYRTAANDTSHFTAGYSKGLQLLQQQEAARTNDLLGRVVGAPEGQMQNPGTGASDVLYGTSGAIPATSLAAQGAAAYATAAGYPAEALGRGQQAIRANILEGNKTQQDLSDKLADQLAGLPGKAQEYLAALQKDQRDQAQYYETQADKKAAAKLAQSNSDRSFKLQVDKLNLAKAATNKKYATDLAKQMTKDTGYLFLPGANGQPSLQKDANGKPVLTVAGTDAEFQRWYKQQQVTATKDRVAISQQQADISAASLKLRQLTGDRNYQAKLDQLGISDAKLQLQIAQFEWKKKHPSAKGGLTANQLQKLRGQADASAQDAFNGVSADDHIVKRIDAQGKVVWQGVAIDPLSYQDAVKAMIGHFGLTETLRALNRWYPKDQRTVGGVPFGLGGSAGGAQGSQPGARTTQGGGAEGAPQGDLATVAKAPAWQKAQVVDSILNAAEAQLGQPYVWGGESRDEGGFDCSGLIDWAYRQAGVNLPGRLTSWTAATMGRSVRGQQMEYGDLIISNGGKHVTMYIGNGQVIASTGGPSDTRGHTAPGHMVVKQAVPSGVIDVRRLIDVKGP